MTGMPPPPLQANPALVSNPTISVDSVSKHFGQKVAVSGLSVSFGQGLTGLLGPNGAGKTTLLRIMCGLTAPSEGAVYVAGKQPRKDHTAYRDLGLVPEEDAVYPYLTGRELVEYAARLSRVSSPSAAAGKAIDQVEMGEAADRRVGGYSKGMRQRIKVAAALVHEPTVLILDEPLNGTDPAQRAHLISLFHQLAQQGHSVVVSSHVLSEIERMATRIVAMVDGRLAAAGDMAAIRRAMSHIPYRISIETDQPRLLAQSLIAMPLVESMQVEGNTLTFGTTDVVALGTAIPQLASTLGVQLTRYRPEDQSLESIFRYLVKR